MTNRASRETISSMRIGQGLRVVLVCGSVAAAAASATAPGKHNVKTSTTVAHGFDATWNAVIDVFSDRGWDIANMEKASGLITSDWMSLRRDDMAAVDCGSEGINAVMATQVRFNVRVKGNDKTSTVAVNTKFRQERRFDNTTHVVDCVSTGVIEAIIQRDVRIGAAEQRSGVTLAAKPAVAAPTAPRGFYCASSAAAGFCVRDKQECVKTRDISVAAVTDMTECTLTESAWCTGELCFPTTETCEQRRARGSDEAACEQRE